MSTFHRVRTDLTVVGGGLSGVCAAIAAARQGIEVALINDRPVLGGNSSSEIRVWINGASGPPRDHRCAGRNLRYAREGGIVEELLLRNKYINPDGNAYLWDMVLIDAVRSERNIKLFLNTVVTDVEMSGPRTVRLVKGYQLMSERRIEFESPRFVDATGDGLIAYQAGAEFRVGCESRDIYNESMAPVAGSSYTMGSTIMFSTKDVGHAVEYRPPSFAYDFKKNPPRSIEKRANPSDSRCCWWWIEWGGELDTIRDNETIRDELLAIVYGVWDYIKNSGRFPEAETLQLEWVGSVPGKRESRRFIGPYVITEHDIVDQQAFPDTVAHGGWPIDLHPPEGLYEPKGRGSEHLWLSGPYEIPYRVLISKDLDNVWLGGRALSASHVAFGSIRVQKTLGAVGQAIGTAAAIAHRHGLNVREVGVSHIGALQQQLLRDDQWLIGVQNNDDRDLARQASVTSSSVRSYSAEGKFWQQLDSDLALTFPTSPNLRTITLRLRAKRDGTMTVDLWTPRKAQNLIPEQPVEKRVLALKKGEQDVNIGIIDLTAYAGCVGLTLPGTPDVSLWSTDEELSCVTAAIGYSYDQGPFWKLVPWIPAFRTGSASPYKAENVINGYSRPYAGPNSWISQPIGDVPEWIELKWNEPKTIHTVQLTLNSSLNWNFLNLEKTESPVVPTIVRDYRILAREGDTWRCLVTVEGNYQKMRRHTFEPVSTERIRVEILATNGAPCAEIFEVRVY